ncbi:MAG: helix-turn-helix domain-containing protein [Gammaproteobacteria bacterium]
MRSASQDVLPPRLRRTLVKLGSDIALARRKRALTVEMMAERVGVSRTTYQKIEKGEPSVSIAVYAMALFVLGFEDALASVADASTDDTGLVLDAERLPKRVRPKKKSGAL